MKHKNLKKNKENPQTNHKKDANFYFKFTFVQELCNFLKLFLDNCHQEQSVLLCVYAVNMIALIMALFKFYKKRVNDFPPLLLYVISQQY